MDATYEVFTDPWNELLSERRRHIATLQMLKRYRKQAEQLNGNGGVLEGRCRLCADPRGGIGQEYRAQCVCQASGEHIAVEGARLAKEPRRGKKADANLFAPPAPQPVEFVPLPQTTPGIPEPAE